MAFQPMTIDEYHRCTTCGQSHRCVASFIARIDPLIPNTLLGFSANYLIPDLLATPVQQSADPIKAPRYAGLEKDHIGNRHLLGLAY